jgi:hypothetical protein
MIPALLVPAALGALLAVLVPLVIHIARRTETQTIDFAALRWLNPNPKPVQRLRLDERLLLVVRIALVVAIVMALAEPVLRPTGDGRPVVAVSPAVDAKSIPDRGERRVWLAPGFPSLDRPAPPATDFASLVRQLDAETPGKTAITIVSPPELTGDAERPYLSRKVDWRVGTARRSAPIPAPTPPALTVRYSPANERAVGYFRAAATAFAEPGKPPAFDAALTNSTVPDTARYLVWLSSAPMPVPVLDWIEAGGVALLTQDAPSPVEGAQFTAWRDADGAPLATAGRFGKGRVLRLTRPLEPSAMPALVEPDFPEQLWTLLAPPRAPDRVVADDYAPGVRATSSAAYNPHPVNLRSWLALLIALIFVAERWLATRRNRP